jgi:hypothetical protein
MLTVVAARLRVLDSMVLSLPSSIVAAADSISLGVNRRVFILQDVAVKVVV